MYTHSQLLLKYLQYYFTASNGKGHGTHSPFVFNFINYVLNNNGQFAPPPAIEALRQQLLREEAWIPVNDLGAGSRKNNASQKRIKEIAKTALIPQKYGQLLYRLVQHYQPQTVIELGTSLGITTAYFAAANPVAQIITIEGSPAIAATAAANFQKLALKNIRLVEGDFNKVLPSILSPLSFVDLAFIDGNHQYGPTLQYFQQLLLKKQNYTVLIFDDIHWSDGMEKAWQEIQKHPAVRCTIDLFFLGIVLFKEEFKEPQHFVIRY